VPGVWLVLPTYDEAENLEPVVRAALPRLAEAAEDHHLLIVDDSSPDGTGDIVRSIAKTEPRVRLIERPNKSGLGSAYLEGFRVTLDEGYDLGVEMDSDLSHDPSQLSALLATARTHDLVVGSRYVPGGSVSNWSPSRVWLSRAGNAYARLMLGVPIHDATSGYRAYRRELLESLLARPMTSDGYGFQIELVMRADRRGYSVAEVPITFREREHGRSKISRRIVVEALWLVTRWGSAIRFGRDPGA
jgi:dolichol-phosphate mannosyltransferase